MSRTSWIAACATLVVYPALRAAELDFYLAGGPSDWWRFWGFAAIGHWTCFGLVAWSLKRDGRSWADIGVDWSWFARRRVPVLIGAGALVAALVVVSLAAPGESRSGLFPLQALTLTERLFMILGAIVTAGVVEEIVFRGFAITLLGEQLGGPWRALPISMVSFFFIHGTPSDPGRVIGIVVVGFLFGAAFILMRCRHLERLIVVHGLLNLPLLLMP